MNVRLGINPLTWSNDDLPRLGAEVPLQTCLAEAAEAGYAGVELGSKFPRDATVLAPLLAQHGLALVSGWYSLRLLERDVDAEWESMQPHFRLLRALGCEVMVCCEVSGAVHGNMDTRLSLRPQLAPAQCAPFASRLERLARRMREHGMRMAYHHHMGTVIQTEAEIDRLMETCDPAVELLLDTGHLLFAGGEPARAAARHAARIAHVHCKDLRAAVLRRSLNRDTSFLDAVLAGVFTVPGDGCIDYAAVLAPLREHGYRGWLVVEAEQDPSVAPSLAYARKGYEHLRVMATPSPPRSPPSRPA